MLDVFQRLIPSVKHTINSNGAIRSVGTVRTNFEVLYEQNSVLPLFSGVRQNSSSETQFKRIRTFEEGALE